MSMTRDARPLMYGGVACAAAIIVGLSITRAQTGDDAAPPPAKADEAKAATGQTADAEPYMQEALAILDLIIQGAIDQAVKRMFEPIEHHDGIGVQKHRTRTRLYVIHDGAGESDGFEIVAEIPVTQRFRRLYALLYYDRDLVLCRMDLARVQGRWRVWQFSAPLTRRLASQVRPETLEIITLAPAHLAGQALDPTTRHEFLRSAELFAQAALIEEMKDDLAIRWALMR